MFCESEGCVEFEPKDPIGVRGLDGKDGRNVVVYGSKVVL
jgi:hypothetical protein